MTTTTVLAAPTSTDVAVYPTFVARATSCDGTTKSGKARRDALAATANSVASAYIMRQRFDVAIRWAATAKAVADLPDRPTLSAVDNAAISVGRLVDAIYAVRTTLSDDDATSFDGLFPWLSYAERPTTTDTTATPDSVVQSIIASATKRSDRAPKRSIGGVLDVVFSDYPSGHAMTVAQIRRAYAESPNRVLGYMPGSGALSARLRSTPFTLPGYEPTTLNGVLAFRKI